MKWYAMIEWKQSYLLQDLLNKHYEGAKEVLVKIWKKDNL